MKKTLITCLVSTAYLLQAQNLDSLNKAKKPEEKSALKYSINSDGSHYIQATLLNQTWVRFNESNPGSTQFQKSVPNTLDIGLRRTRMQVFGQIDNRTFIYFQFGQNNFNNTFNAPTAATSGTNTSYTYPNRKLAAFFHDALCEYKISKGNQLKIGGGLTVLNGLSRFAQPSVSTIMTMDVPVFLQYSVDQIDQFDRRLAVYARGVVKKIDYRVYMSDPFPVGSNGSSPAALSTNATFVNTIQYKQGHGPGIHKQFGGYVAYNFFDTENNTTPYMPGTSLGNKKIFNIACGAVFQKSATWRQTLGSDGLVKDTIFENMLHLSIESYLDMPLNKEKGTAISAFAGYFNTNYGKNYLRYNGIMNPATGSTANNMVQSNAYGNAVPMFGTGQVVYTQCGILLPKNLLGEGHGQLMPYVSGEYADYFALQNKAMLIFNAGINWLINGQKSKLSLDYQNRPTYYKNTANNIAKGPRKSCVTLQYQIFF